ncbi:hypothetical protein HUJ04_009281 [Dendroctonus ponderosae]|nr:hypothetical protein HUJ04_009281 [Dendroctonus ponderosae]
MKSKSVSSSKFRSSDMKTVPINLKKNDQKTPNIALGNRDTIAETIAFVIKGQLTPIQLTPLTDTKSSKTDIKRLQKSRYCKNKVAPDPVKAKPLNDRKLKIADKPVLAIEKPESSVLANEDLDTSIKKIIRRYAKKLRIKRTKRKRVVQPTNEAQSKTTDKDKASEGLDAKAAPLRKPPIPIVAADAILKPRKKYVKRKANNKQINANAPETSSERNADTPKSIVEIIEVKIKEEKVDEEFPIFVKTEPGLESGPAPKPCEEIKPEPPVAKVPPAPGPKSPKAKRPVIPHKLKQLKKKSLISRDAQKQLEDKRRAKLLQFWNSPKRHREASLNALAKVHCLYENESKSAFDQMTESSIIKREPAAFPDKSKKCSNARKLSSDSSSESDSDEEQPVKRILRDVPGLRAIGKHWDMHDSISSDNNSDLELPRPPKKPKVKKEPAKKVAKPARTEVKDQQKSKRKPKPEVLMDLKDMVVKKRMASLNASAILTASYSTDKKAKPRKTTDSSSYDSDSSAEEYFAAIEQIDLTKDTKEDIKQEEEQNLIEVHTSPNKKVAVILNQDTDVTITGVYVNSTRSTHHEGYCSIAGMQYRISATSHTQTAATTVAAEALLQSGSNSDNVSRCS